MRVEFVLCVLLAGLGVSCSQHSGALRPHPEKCALYYNTSTSSPTPEHDRDWEECPNPQLFNTDNHRCEHYTMVNCGDRTEPFWPCDYRKMTCWGMGCIPCFVRHSDCTGFPDGPNARPDRPNSPYYVVCKDQRPVYEGECKKHIFDAQTRECKCE